MNITYNNIETPVENLVTFTELPNILKVTEDVTGTKANIRFLVGSDIAPTVTADSQYFISVLGETITNVMNPSMATNKRFFIANDVNSTAVSIARAFRNCGSLNSQFVITSSSGGVVTLEARNIGAIWDYSDQNWWRQSNNFSGKIGVIAINGTSYSDFANSKIIVDVYNVDASGQEPDTYVTSLEKNWYGNECAFDVSPVLATMSEFGVSKPYNFKLSRIDASGNYSELGEASGNTVIGYHANQSSDYMYAYGVQMLINKSRGDEGSILYVYENNIPFSLLYGDDRSGCNVHISAWDSAMQLIYSGDTIGRRGSTSLLKDESISIPDSAFTKAYYINVQIDTNEPVRFNVIKPLKATEYFQRVQWRNEYGGISFFDFTGARSETDSADIETYEKNVFDYYDNYTYERKKIYSNDYKKSVKLTSHLMEKDGKWIFNSLMRSKRVWTEVNGQIYYIIPKSIEVTEDSNYNNIYVATLTYEYSYI